MRVFIPVGLLLALCAGCGKKEGKQAAPAPAAPGQPAKKESVVVVPASVKGKWKAVKIAVTDKETNKETVYTVAIGSAFTIPNSTLSIKVETFLPHFMMDGTTLTSQSNEPQNPAAQIAISEGGKEIFKGWLFARFPTTHAFQHPKYGFTLADYIPAG